MGTQFAIELASELTAERAELSLPRELASFSRVYFMNSCSFVMNME